MCENPQGLSCRKSELVKFSVLVYTTEVCLLVLQAFCLVVTFCYFVTCGHFTNLLLLDGVGFFDYFFFYLVEDKDSFPGE